MESAITTLGSDMLTLSCLARAENPSDLFFTQQILFALLPLLAPFPMKIIWERAHTKISSSAGEAGEASLASKLSSSSRMQSSSFGTYILNASDKFVITLCTFLFLTYPPLCRNTLELFSCVNIAPLSKSYMKYGMDQECWDSRHLTYVLVLGIPKSLILLIFMPVFSFFFIRHEKSLLSAEVFAARYQTFVAGLEIEGTWWWEFPIMLRKVLLFGIIVSGQSYGGMMQAHLCVLIIGISGAMHIRFSPYRDSRANSFESVSLMTAALTMWFAVTIGALPTQMEWFSELMTVLIVAVNICFLSYFTFLIAKVKHDELESFKVQRQWIGNESALSRIARKMTSGFSSRARPEEANPGNVELSIQRDNEEESSEWEKYYSEEHSQYYLVHAITGESRWMDSFNDANNIMSRDGTNLQQQQHEQ